MAVFIFRCPSTGLNVQGWLPEGETPRNEGTYESVSCLACKQTHFVDRATGRTLGHGGQTAASNKI
jgi:hypothetical protein